MNVTIVLMGLTAVPLTVILDTRDGTATCKWSVIPRNFLGGGLGQETYMFCRTNHGTSY